MQRQMGKSQGGQKTKSRSKGKAKAKAFTEISAKKGKAGRAG